MHPTSYRSALIPRTSSFCAALLMLTVLAFAAPGFAQVSFQPPSVHSSPNIPNDIFLFDLNTDNKTDIITTQSGSNMVSVFFNNGDGTFPAGPSATYTTGGVSVSSVVATDFNEDGIQDLATANCGNDPDPPQTPVPSSVSILSGPTFGSHTDYPLPACPDSIQVIAVVTQSLPSLVVSYNSSNLTLLMNNGDGLFTEKTVNGPSGALLRGISVADFNGDSRQDIAAVIENPAGSTTDSVVIFYQNNDGSFGPATTVYNGNTFLVATNAAGFNASGRPDLLVPFTPAAGVNQPAGVIALTNNGGGSFSPIQLDVDHTYNPGGKAAEGDLQGKGLHSIILPVTTLNSSNALFSAFAIFIQQSPGGFLGPFYFAGDVNGSPHAVAVTDFNGDGLLDFAAAGGEDDHLLIYQNSTTGATCPFFVGSGGVHVCTPGAGSSVGSPVVIGASASTGLLPIVAMKAYIDGTQVSANDTNTLNSSVAKSVGTHQLAVNAWDPNGKVYQTIVNFTVGSGSAGCSAPSSAGVQICAPGAGATVSSPVAISAAANGGANKISAMKAYIDGTQVASSTSGSLSGSAAEATGTHKLTVNAWNTAGTLFQSSVTFTVK
jgi:hypothetical protein